MLIYFTKKLLFFTKCKWFAENISLLSVACSFSNEMQYAYQLTIQLLPATEHTTM